MGTTMKLKIFAGISAFAVIAGFFLFSIVQAHISKDVPSVTPDTYRNFTFFASSTEQTNYATTTTATSTNIIPYFDSNGTLDKGYFVIAGAKAVSLYFQRGEAGGIVAGGNTGTTTFKIQTSADGTTWNDFNKFVQGTSTIVQLLNPKIGFNGGETGTSTDIFGMNLDYGTFFAIRCIVVEFTNGEHSCRASAQF